MEFLYLCNLYQCTLEKAKYSSFGFMQNCDQVVEINKYRSRISTLVLFHNFRAFRELYLARSVVLKALGVQASYLGGVKAL